MSFFTKALAVTVALSSIGGAYAKLDLKSRDNVVVYWGMFCATAKCNGIEAYRRCRAKLHWSK